MQDFWLWFTIGLQHICDWRGYDHILFITALCIAYPAQEWKRLLILATAFTIGHSLTLALSVLNIINTPSAIIEFLIPLTIMATCIANIVRRDKLIKNMNLNYFLAGFFGCIHGLGFSYLLKSLLGKEESIIGPLFSFNLGLEAGQILIIAGIMLISLTLPLLVKIKKGSLNFFVSSAIFGIAFIMTIDRFKNVFN